MSRKQGRFSSCAKLDFLQMYVWMGFPKHRRNNNRNRSPALSLQRKPTIWLGITLFDINFFGFVWLECRPKEIPFVVGTSNNKHRINIWTSEPFRRNPDASNVYTARQSPHLTGSDLRVFRSLAPVPLRPLDVDFILARCKKKAVIRFPG